MNEIACYFDRIIHRLIAVGYSNQQACSVHLRQDAFLFGFVSQICRKVLFAAAFSVLALVFIHQCRDFLIAIKEHIAIVLRADNSTFHRFTVECDGIITVTAAYSFVARRCYDTADDYVLCFVRACCERSVKLCKIIRNLAFHFLAFGRTDIRYFLIGSAIIPCKSSRHLADRFFACIGMNVDMAHTFTCCTARYDDLIVLLELMVKRRNCDRNGRFIVCFCRRIHRERCLFPTRILACIQIDIVHALHAAAYCDRIVSCRFRVCFGFGTADCRRRDICFTRRGNIKRIGCRKRNVAACSARLGNERFTLTERYVISDGRCRIGNGESIPDDHTAFYDTAVGKLCLGQCFVRLIFVCRDVRIDHHVCLFRHGHRGYIALNIDCTVVVAFCRIRVRITRLDVVFRKHLDIIGCDITAKCNACVTFDIVFGSRSAEGRRTTANRIGIDIGTICLDSFDLDRSCDVPVTAYIDIRIVVHVAFGTCRFVGRQDPAAVGFCSGIIISLAVCFDSQRPDCTVSQYIDRNRIVSRARCGIVACCNADTDIEVFDVGLGFCLGRTDNSQLGRILIRTVSDDHVRLRFDLCLARTSARRNGTSVYRNNVCFGSRFISCADSTFQ